MGDLKRGVKRGWKSVRNTYDDVIEGSRQIGEKIGFSQYGLKSDKTERKERAAQDAIDEANKPMPMADEEEIERSKRRTNSARGSGRASTIFTDSDRLGP